VPAQTRQKLGAATVGHSCGLVAGLKLTVLESFTHQQKPHIIPLKRSRAYKENSRKRLAVGDASNPAVGGLSSGFLLTHSLKRPLRPRLLLHKRSSTGY
jgi:hypothetical protein